MSTVSRIGLDPNDIRYIADSATFTCDLRDPDRATFGGMVETVVAEAEVAADRDGIGFECRELVSQPCVPFAAHPVDALQSAADGLCSESIRTPSMGLHGARWVADVVDTPMVFAVGAVGLSHSPEEYTSPRTARRRSTRLPGPLPS